jgi:hypothetical protein
MQRSFGVELRKTQHEQMSSALPQEGRWLSIPKTLRESSVVEHRTNECLRTNPHRARLSRNQRRPGLAAGDRHHNRNPAEGGEAFRKRRRAGFEIKHRQQDDERKEDRPHQIVGFNPPQRRDACDQQRGRQRCKGYDFPPGEAEKVRRCEDAAQDLRQPGPSAPRFGPLAMRACHSTPCRVGPSDGRLSGGRLRCFGGRLGARERLP